MSCFESELKMHTEICNFFAQNLQLSDVHIQSEVQGLFGIPDIILAEEKDGVISHVIAVELKLHSWRKGLTQAFKYQSFAWETYVIVDDRRMRPAAANLELFRKYNIGLGTYSVEGKFKIVYKPTIRTPYSKNMFSKLCHHTGVGVSGAVKITNKPNRKSGLGKAFQRLENIELCQHRHGES